MERQKNRQATQELIQSIEKRLEIKKKLELENPTPHSREIELESRKLLRLFKEPIQVHQLAIQLRRAYSGLSVGLWTAQKVIKQLETKGLIELTGFTLYRDGTIVKYYAVTDKGWKIAHPIVYPPRRFFE